MWPFLSTSVHNMCFDCRRVFFFFSSIRFNHLKHKNKCQQRTARTSHFKTFSPALILCLRTSCAIIGHWLDRQQQQQQKGRSRAASNARGLGVRQHVCCWGFPSVTSIHNFQRMQSESSTSSADKSRGYRCSAAIYSSRLLWLNSRRSFHVISHLEGAIASNGEFIEHKDPLASKSHPASQRNNRKNQPYVSAEKIILLSLFLFSSAFTFQPSLLESLSKAISIIYCW